MIAALLILALSLPAAPAPAPTPVRVVFVATDEGGYTSEQQADILARMERALAFWSDRAPTPIATQVEAAGTLAAPADLTLWVADLTPHSDATVYVVNNEATGLPLPGGSYGAASYAYRFALVTSRAPLGAEAVLAHELGHLLYDLDHVCPRDGGSDIMCNHVGAYRLGKLGCGTLGQLGRPCQRVGLAMIAEPYR
jgi:hypothetical protein